MLVEMVLSEGGIAYELRDVDILKNQHRDPEYQALNPFGWIPALVTPDGETIAETPAINLWLCEAHGLDLVPPVGDPLRGRFLTAFHNVIGEIEPTIKRVFFPHRYALDDSQTGATRDLAQRMLEDRLAPIERQLAGAGPFFLGDRFSLADLTLAYWLPYVERWGGLADLPHVQSVLDRVRDRPGLVSIFQRQAAWTERLKKARKS